MRVMCYERYPRFHTFWGPWRWSDQLSISQHPCSWLPPARAATGSQGGRYRESKRDRDKGDAIKELLNWIFTLKIWGYMYRLSTECMFMLVCKIYSQVISLSHEKSKSLACSFTYSNTLEGMRWARLAKYQKKKLWPKHPRNTVKSGNIMDQNNLDPACKHSVTLCSKTV